MNHRLAQTCCLAACLLAAGFAGAQVPADTLPTDTASPSTAPSTSVPPPPAPTLSLSAAVADALASHPTVAAARSAEAAAAARSDAAVADRRPQAAFRADATRYQEPTVVTPIHGFGPGQFPEFDRSVGHGELSVRYDLWDGGADAARLAGARAERSAAGEALAASEDELVAATVTAYVRVQSLAAVADAQDRRLAALDAERRRVDQLYAVGRAADVDRKRIRAARAAAEAERQSLATSLDTAERELARLTGLAPEATRAGGLQPVSLGDGALPGRDELDERALAANPQVARAEARAAGAEAAIELARSVRRPHLAARGAFQEFASSSGLQAGEWQAGLELTVPLFDGGRVAARVRAAKADRDAARAAVETARLAVRDGVDRALAAFDQATARVASLDEAVDGYAEVARVEALRLANGAGTQSDLLDAEADLLAARARRAEARFARITARTELARVTGDLDAAWIGSTLEGAPPAAPGPTPPSEPAITVPEPTSPESAGSDPASAASEPPSNAMPVAVTATIPHPEES